MDLLDGIRTRRSIRQYVDREVSEEDVRTILDAAMMAPSAGNSQPWHFVVVRDRGLLAAIPEIHPYAAMTKNAAVGILVCGDTSVEKYPGNWPVDCAAAVQNLLLSAHALGLGAVWTGVWPNEVREQKFRDMFGIPSNVVPLAFVPIGHPAAEPPSASRYRAERVHRDRW